MKPITEHPEDSEPSEGTKHLDSDEDLGRSGEHIDLTEVEVKSSEKGPQKAILTKEEVESIKE